MAIKYKQWRPPGIYITDIAKFTGYANVKAACAKAGVTLWKLSPGRYNPIAPEEAYKVIRWIRYAQGIRLLRSVRLT